MTLHWLTITDPDPVTTAIHFTVEIPARIRETVHTDIRPHRIVVETQDENDPTIWIPVALARTLAEGHDMITTMQALGAFDGRHDR